MAPTPDGGTRGLVLAVLGLLLIPLVLLLVALLPEGWRTSGFLLGLIVVGAVAGRGGWTARTAFADGAPHPVRAFLGATIGLVVAVTASMVCIWSAIGMAIG